MSNNNSLFLQRPFQSILSIFASNIFLLYIPFAVFLLLLLNSQAIIYPDWLPVHDTSNQITEFLYTVSAYQNNELPLWNSYLYGGHPFYLLLNHGLLLNPIMWIWIICGTFLNLSHISIFVYYHLTDIVFFALGGFFLIREIIKDDFVAAVAFIILLFSGDANYWSNQIWDLTVIICVPWILFFGARYFQRQTVLRAITFAIFLGISVNVYIPLYMTAFIITLALLLLIYRFDLIASIDFKRLFRHILIVSPILVTLILPLYLTYSEITHDNYQIGRFRGIDQQQIKYEDRTATGVIISKGDMDRIFPGMFAVKRHYTESVPLIGIFAFVFMIMGASAFSRNSQLWLGLLLAMILSYNAWSTPYHYISFYLMPFYKMIRSYGFFSGYIVLIATVLACIGLKDLLKKFSNGGKINFWKMKSEVLILLALIGLSFYLPHKDRFFLLIVVSVGLFLFLINNYYKIATILSSYKHILIIFFLAIGAYNLSVINGFNWHNIRAYMFTYSSKFNFTFTRPDQYREGHLPMMPEMPYANLLCCKTFYNIAEKFDGPWFFDTWGGGHTLFVDKNYYHLSGIKGFPLLMKDKLHFFKHYTVMDNPTAKIGNFEQYLKKSILVLDNDNRVNFRNAKIDSNAVERMAEIEKVLPAELSLGRKTANTISFNVDVPEDVFMLYTDLYYEGFEAGIDGKSAPILKGMGAFKAVELSKGKHIVEFKFRPFYSYALLFYLIVSIGFFVYLGILGIWEIVASKEVSKTVISGAVLLLLFQIGVM